MTIKPTWMLEVIDDLLRYAQDNCRPEIAFHLESAGRHLGPYLSQDAPLPRSDPEVQVVADLLDDLISYAANRGHDEAHLHLMAARKRLVQTEPRDIAQGKVITFPVTRDRNGGSQGG
jgi:hypothetical protein